MKFGQYRHRPGQQNVAVVGGILGLEPQYSRILEESDFSPRIYNHIDTNISKRVSGAALKKFVSRVR